MTLETVAKLKIVGGRVDLECVTQPAYVLYVIAGVTICFQITIEARPVRRIRPDLRRESVQQLTRRS